MTKILTNWCQSTW